MKRFVTYIYEYERGTRGRNTGFIRTDIRDNGCRMEIHIRGLDRFKGKCMVYLIVDSDDVIGIPAAEILISQGAGLLKLDCPQNKIGNSGYIISDLQAVAIRYGGGKVLAGCFTAEPSEKILRGEFEIYGAKKTMDTPIAEAIPEPPTPNPVADTVPAKTATVPESEGTAPASIPEPESAVPPQTDGKSMESMSKTAATKNTTDYQRIEITDIRRLPRNNWHLCNNSFLVHGFFNYHYLILKTVENNGEIQRYLGVPGIYEQSERMMALLFGFPEFEAEQKNSAGKPIPSSANGVFGYWLCPLSVS